MKRLIPNSLKKLLLPYILKYRISKAKSNQRKALNQILKKEKVRIAFLIVNQSIWKYDVLYQLFDKNPMYDVKIFICPFMSYGDIEMQREMTGIYNSFTEKKYNVEKTLQIDGSWLDIKNSFNPDVVFFSTPWLHSLPKYTIINFIDRLTCYAPYGFKSSNLYQQHFNLETQNLSWKFFLETEVHQKLAKIYGARNAENTIVTGSPGIDSLMTKRNDTHSKWKEQKVTKKKIIWAPHHTIPGANNLLSYSTFLDYAEFMFTVAQEYEDFIQVAFKPHPNLRGKLNDIWGVKKTDKYYNKWQDLPNGQLEDGEYVDLFQESDAMIHDSGSFVIEYLCINKPVLFLISSEKVKEEFNEIGIRALSIMEQGYDHNDITSFIEEVLKGNDKKKNERMTFFNDIIKPPNDLTASENIYNYITTIIKNKNE